MRSSSPTTSMVLSTTNSEWPYSSSLGTENAFVVLAEVNALARQGRDIISFCIGQPDFPAPDNVQEAAIRAIRSGKHGYTSSAGIDELREAVAGYLAAMRGGLPIG